MIAVDDRPRVRQDKAPFPWFGGKSQAAPTVWAALGDVEHYVEPFAGTLAVLLRRPHLANRPYHSETVNDLDGLLVNAWRAIQLSPDETADAASNPVAEADLHARHLALVRWRAEHQLEHLMGDPGWHDPTMAGWWLWGVSCWIGGGWCAGTGSWTEVDGRLVKQDHSGVTRKLPALGNDGLGVNRPQLREPGVDRKRPHLGDDGLGVNRPQLREPGVFRQRPHLSDNGLGVNRPQLREPDLGDPYHPVTMPQLRLWFRWLSARLRHVRILNGSWTRAVTNGATLSLSVRQGGHVGVFLDPPYSLDVRAGGLYAHDDDADLAGAVRAWALEHGDDPRYRIVLAGFHGEHDLPGWRPVEWFTAGWLSGGMANVGTDGHQQQLERLWLSPHCLAPTAPAAEGLW